MLNIINSNIIIIICIQITQTFIQNVKTYLLRFLIIAVLIYKTKSISHFNLVNVPGYRGYFFI